MGYYLEEFEHKAIMPGWGSKRTVLGVEYKPFSSNGSAALATRPAPRPTPRPVAPATPKNRPFPLVPGEVAYAQIEDSVVSPALVRAAKWAVDHFCSLQFKTYGAPWHLVYIRWIRELRPQDVEDLKQYGIHPDDHTYYLKQRGGVKGTTDILHPDHIYLSDQLSDPYDVISTASHECAHTWQIKHQGAPVNATEVERYEREAEQFAREMVDYARKEYRR